MSPNACDTAILLFSRSAAEESVAKPLLAHAKKMNRALSADLIRHVRRLSRHSGLPVFFISEQQQQGVTFGERFSNAFRQVFDKGFSKVIAIGNDCPGLCTKDLCDTAEKLCRHTMVVGPATDGGAYLIGLHKDTFDAESFSAIRWQTTSVFEDLIQWHTGDFTCLDIKSDLDSETDLKQALLHHIFSLRLGARILALLQSFSARVFPANAAFYYLFSPDCPSSRGPPGLSFHF